MADNNYKSLYRKYRPKSFRDVYGQEHITKVLENQIENNKVSHAYLFCGSRGTGKTTCAKILAKAVNCQSEGGENGGVKPCNKCDICMGIENGSIIDVLEIDAASNNGVENIRDIRDDVAYTPGDSNKKVYIIDEVHMLSSGAFNALLKTLEEPPPHIIFILATTEINKIPATVLSRCQRHDFRRLPPEIIAECLNNICAKENINIEEKAVNLISRLSGGAMRDALNILEACAANQNNIDLIKFDYVAKVSGYFDVEKIISLCVCVKDGDAAGALEIFWDIYQNSGSSDCGNFCSSLLEMFRNIQIAKISDKNPALKYINLEKSEAEKIIEISKDFDNISILNCCKIISDVIINLGRYTANKRAAVEIMLVEMCLDNPRPSGTPFTEGGGNRGNNSENGGDRGSNRENSGSGERGISPPPSVKGVTSADGGGCRYFGKYADLIEEVGKENKMIVAYLKSADCVIDENAKKIIIYTDSNFKLNILKEQKNIQFLNDNVKKFLPPDYSAQIELKPGQKSDKTNENNIGIDDILNNA